MFVCTLLRVTVILLYRGCFCLFLRWLTLVCDIHFDVPWLLLLIFILVRRSFNDYDNTFDGCLFRNNGIGVECGAANAYIRNCRFENSSLYDINAGWVYWLHSSVHRVVSVGSEAFMRGTGNGVSIMDCHVDSWFGTRHNTLHSHSLCLCTCLFTCL
jgi:hypothetical protein